jgi:hypothetical protein
MNRPAKMAAPPMPTTTPIMVFRVVVLMPLSLFELLELFKAAAAELAAAAEDVAELKAAVSVDEEVLVTGVPLMVFI